MYGTHEKVRGLVVGLVLVGLAVLIGCGGTTSRLNAPPQGHAADVSPLREYYIAMGDNALLAEGSMSPVHFVPRTAELNTLGVRRLTRYAEFLKIYGGTCTYDGSDEGGLRQQRLEQIESFLLACGVEEGTFVVDAGPAGGMGMAATEASEIRKETRGPGRTKIITENWSVTPGVSETAGLNKAVGD